jgi:hypothetical protein
VWLRDHRVGEWVAVPWVYRSLAGQPFGIALWEHARRMTADRRGPRPAEADTARAVASLLRRAHGHNLSKEDAKAVAVDSNRPARWPADGLADHDDPPEAADEPSGQPEPAGTGAEGAYEVFAPEAMPWQL